MYDYLVTEKEIKSQNKSEEVCARKWWKTKKASSFEEAFVPGAGVEPARFPTGVWDQRVYQFRHPGLADIK